MSNQPLKLKHLEGGHGIAGFNLELARGQEILVKHQQAFGERAEGAKVKIRLDVELEMLDGAVRITSQTGIVAIPKRPARVMLGTLNHTKTRVNVVPGTNDSDAIGQELLFQPDPAESAGVKPEEEEE